MLGKALKMEKDVLDIYGNNDLDSTVKIDVIVNTVEEFVTECLQAMTICSDNMRRELQARNSDNRIGIDDS